MQTKLIPILDLGPTPLANALLSRAQLNQPEATLSSQTRLLSGLRARPDHRDCAAGTVVLASTSIFPRSPTRCCAMPRLLPETHSYKRSSIGNSLVMEVASNDGYLLQFYQRAGVPVLGIEPATNVARVAEERGIPTVCEFLRRRRWPTTKDEGQTCRT